MEVHGFDEHGNIKVTFDGVLSLVPNDMANRHRREIAEWEALGNTIPPYVPPAPPPEEKEVYLFAAAYDLFVQDGEIQSLTAVDSSIFGFAWIDVGYYECYLADVYEDMDYYPKVWDHGANMQVIEKTPDYFVITSTDDNGVPVDPEKFNVEINTIR